MSRQSLSQPHSQRGIALIAVLLLLVFILTLVGGMFYRHQIHIQKTSRNLLGEQALLLLMSAESWASKMLADDARESSTDHLDEDWSKRLPALPLEGSTISGCLKDLQGRFNLNNLAWYTNKSWDDELATEGFVVDKASRRLILRNLLQLQGLDGSDGRIASLVDWVDADAWLLTPDSAEDNEYLLQNPPYRPANHDLVELSELSLIQGFGAADVIGLAPLVTVLPGQEITVNINTAGEQVMAALLPEITPAIYQQIDDARPFENLDEFYTLLAAVVGDTRQNLKSRLPMEFIGIGSDYFELLADVELAGVRMTYRSTLYREGGQNVQVLRRTLNYVPPLSARENEQADEQLSVRTLCQQASEVTPTL